MTIQIRKHLPLGMRNGWLEGGITNGKILYLDLGGSYTSVCNFEIPNCTLMISPFYFQKNQCNSNLIEYI